MMIELGHDNQGDQLNSGDENWTAGSMHGLEWWPPQSWIFPSKGKSFVDMEIAGGHKHKGKGRSGHLHPSCTRKP